MRPPPYPLQALLRRREAAKLAAARALGEALLAADREAQSLTREQAARDALLADRGRRACHLYDSDPCGMLPLPLTLKRSEDLRFLHDRWQEASSLVVARKDALARAEAHVDARRQSLVEADRQLRIVEKHHETWLCDWRKEMTRREERGAEEIVLARYAAEGGSREGSE